MSAEAKTETDKTPKGILLDIAEAIQLAQGHLDKARDHADNPRIADEISVEHKSLDAFLTQLTEAGTIADDALFTKTTGALKLQAASLPSLNDRIKKIASYTNTPNQASVYMQQAINYISLASGMMAKLP
jgi:hypothetical protein